MEGAFGMVGGTGGSASDCELGGGITVEWVAERCRMPHYDDARRCDAMDANISLVDGQSDTSRGCPLAATNTVGAIHLHIPAPQARCLEVGFHLNRKTRC